jgi:CRP/FNR family transcriptional regulator
MAESAALRSFSDLARTTNKASVAPGPTLRANPFGPAASGSVRQLLTDAQRERLARLATTMRVPRKSLLYQEESPATALWFVESGVVKSYRGLANGKTQIMAFLFPGDMFGLAQTGKYVNNTRAVTPVTVHRLPIDALAEVLRHDPELEFQFLCKMAHELRELQRRAIVTGRRDAPGRLAMFVSTLARYEFGKDITQRRISVPMSRSDVAEYLNLTPEALSRAGRQLVRSGILAFPNRQTAQIVDTARFERLISHL